jgi:hypothetical protein
MIKRAASVLLTFALYVLALVAGSSWDAGDPGWGLMALRLSAGALWLWWAVARTVRLCAESSR